MQGVTGAATSAQAYFEQHVRKLSPGFQATINGLSYPLRVLEVVRSQPAAQLVAGLGQGVDAYA